MSGILDPRIPSFRNSAFSQLYIPPQYHITDNIEQQLKSELLLRNSDIAAQWAAMAAHFELLLTNFDWKVYNIEQYRTAAQKWAAFKEFKYSSSEELLWQLKSELLLR